MTRLVDPDTSAQANGNPGFRFSANGKKFFVVTSKGNLQTGLNDYSLLSFDVPEREDIEHPRERNAAAQPAQLATFSTASSEDAIDRVMWEPAGRRLAFIGRHADGIGQVYVVDSITREVERLTFASTDVIDFDIAWTAGRIVYAALTKPDWQSRNAFGYAVKSHDLMQLVASSPSRGDSNVEYFTADLARPSDVERVSTSPLPFASWRPSISISSSGRRAVLMTHTQTIPDSWARYEAVHSSDAEYLSMLTAWSNDSVRYFPDGFGASPNRIENDAIPSSTREQFYQFQIVDLATGASKPLLNAPVIAPPPGLAKAVWSTTDDSVVLPMTYLPLDVDDPSEEDRRRRTPAIVEVDIESGASRRIADFSVTEFFGQPTVTDIAASPTRAPVELEYRAPHTLFVGLGDAYRSRPAGVRLEQQYTRHGEEWQIDMSAGPKPNGDEAVDVLLRQELNVPPIIVAKIPGGVRERILWDINPELKLLKLGRAEVFEWVDALGRKFAGALLFPVDYVRGARYPLVIQTHGFVRDEFLVDGPGATTTAFAARPLASKNIFVLQMDEDGGNLNTDSKQTQKSLAALDENVQFVAATEGAIRALDDRGLIEPSRVGLIGWSRTGMNVHYFVTFSRVSHRGSHDRRCDFSNAILLFRAVWCVIP